ncbi:hypothetical protein B4Q13_16395 [Lacticaseibacillus rhamnosus]
MDGIYKRRTTSNERELNVKRFPHDERAVDPHGQVRLEPAVFGQARAAPQQAHGLGPPPGRQRDQSAAALMTFLLERRCPIAFRAPPSSV